MMLARLSLILPLVAVAGLVGCAQPAKPVRTAAAKPPATSAPGPSSTATRSCVELRDIREAKVVDDRTIDFVLSSRQVLRNTLPNACPGLGFERAFSYSTSLSRLCSVDVITVIVQGGGPRTGASCGLGTFVPHTPVPAK